MQLSFCAIRRIIAAFLIVCWFFLGMEGFKNKCIKEKFTNDEELRIILLWAKWCGHCNKIKNKDNNDSPKEWDKFKSENDGVIRTSKGDVHIQDYEADESPQIVKQLGVTSFPSILLVSKDSNKIVKSESQRTKEDWKTFVLDYVDKVAD